MAWCVLWHPSLIISSQCTGRNQQPQLEGRGRQSREWASRNTTSLFCGQTFCIIKSQPHGAWKQQEMLSVFRTRPKFYQLFDLDCASLEACKKNSALWRWLSMWLALCSRSGFNSFLPGCVVKQESSQTHTLCLVYVWSHVDVLSSQMDGGDLKLTESFCASKTGFLSNEL